MLKSWDEKSKITQVKTDIEKIKFVEWLNINVKQENKGTMVWFDALTNYLGYRTNGITSKVYKEYFTEWCCEKFPDVTTKYLKYKTNGKSHLGYRNFVLNEL